MLMDELCSQIGFACKNVISFHLFTSKIQIMQVLNNFGMEFHPLNEYHSSITEK